MLFLIRGMKKWPVYRGWPLSSWPVYRGNFIKDPMGVRQGNELLAGLERVAGL